MPPPELQIISDFTTRLALRRDGDRVRAALAIAFYDRREAGRQFVRDAAMDREHRR